jgi:hypothetical protein
VRSESLDVGIGEHRLGGLDVAVSEFRRPTSGATGTPPGGEARLVALADQTRSNSANAPNTVPAALPDPPVTATPGGAGIRDDGPRRRLATSVGGVLTGRGADIIVIDDPLKPEEALSQSQRQATNEWFDHTLYSRLNDKGKGAIVLIMHRLHEDDLVGHVLAQEPWEYLRFPAIAEDDEIHMIEAPLESRCVMRRRGEALHPEREPLAMLEQIRRTIGE